MSRFDGRRRHVGHGSNPEMNPTGGRSVPSCGRS
jgi:hypothetical protein